MAEDDALRMFISDNKDIEVKTGGDHKGATVEKPSLRQQGARLINPAHQITFVNDTDERLQVLAVSREQHGSALQSIALSIGAAGVVNVTVHAEWTNLQQAAAADPACTLIDFDLGPKGDPDCRSNKDVSKLDEGLYFAYFVEVDHAWRYCGREFVRKEHTVHITGLGRAPVVP